MSEVDKLNHRGNEITRVNTVLNGVLARLGFDESCYSIRLRLSNGEMQLVDNWMRWALLIRM